MESIEANVATNSFATNKWLPFTKTFFVLLWSSGAIVIVFGLRYTNPYTFLLLRLVFATLFMVIISLVTKAPWPKDWQVFKKIAMTGLLTQFGYTMSYFCALYYGVSPTVMTIILGLQPILTAVIFNHILKAPVAKVQYWGLSLGLLGVCLTVMHDFTTHAITILGFVFAITCVSSITLGSILQKNNPKMDLRTGSVIQFAVSIIPVFILNALFGSFTIPKAPEFFFALGWMVLVVSVSATCLYYKLLRDGSAVAVNSLFYLVPAVTAVLCYFIFHQPLNIYIGLGIVLIVAGVFITQKATH